MVLYELVSVNGKFCILVWKCVMSVVSFLCCVLFLLLWMIVSDVCNVCVWVGGILVL